jgi:hypothetical protein
MQTHPTIIKTILLYVILSLCISLSGCYTPCESYYQRPVTYSTYYSPSYPVNGYTYYRPATLPIIAPWGCRQSSWNRPACQQVPRNCWNNPGQVYQNQRHFTQLPLPDRHGCYQARVHRPINGWIGDCPRPFVNY